MICAVRGECKESVLVDWRCVIFVAQASDTPGMAHTCNVCVCAAYVSGVVAKEAENEIWPADCVCKKLKCTWFFGGNFLFFSFFQRRVLHFTPRFHTKACRAGRGRFTSSSGALLQQRGRCSTHCILSRRRRRRRHLLLLFFAVTDKGRASAWGVFLLHLLWKALSSTTAPLSFLHKQGGVAARQHHSGSSKAAAFVSPTRRRRPRQNNLLLTSLFGLLPRRRQQVKQASA
jgi:hypothetical protein